MFTHGATLSTGPNESQRVPTAPHGPQRVPNKHRSSTPGGPMALPRGATPTPRDTRNPKSTQVCIFPQPWSKLCPPGPYGPQRAPMGPNGPRQASEQHSWWTSGTPKVPTSLLPVAPGISHVHRCVYVPSSKPWPQQRAPTGPTRPRTSTPGVPWLSRGVAKSPRPVTLTQDGELFSLNLQNPKRCADVYKFTHAKPQSQRVSTGPSGSQRVPMGPNGSRQASEQHSWEPHGKTVSAGPHGSQWAPKGLNGPQRAPVPNGPKRFEQDSEQHSWWSHGAPKSRLPRAL